MSGELFLQNRQRILRVAELARAINELLESSVPLLWVRGEISNLVKAASGHWYFALKDEQAQVRCVMFRNRNQLQEFPVANGQLVEVQAVAGLYEARGEFQLTVENLRPAGLGALYEQFERLKQKLAGEGLFAAERKRPLPAFPRRVGVITSLQAAALRDVLSTLKQRLPSVPVIVYPVPVQGAGSAEKIAQAIECANLRAECSVLILCRGGGSIEDLWAFNEEVVARAVANSEIPLVSGIGHETDFTIADFVADERAPTPTAAAQRAVPDRHALLRGIDDKARHLLRPMRNRLQNAMQTLDYLQRRLVHPEQQLRQKSSQLEQMERRLMRSYGHYLEQQSWRCGALSQRLQGAGSDFSRMQETQRHLGLRLCNAAAMLQQRRQAALDAAQQHLALLCPERVLSRGYSLVQDGDGHLVTDAEELEVGATLRIVLARGWAEADVTKTGS